MFDQIYATAAHVVVAVAPAAPHASLSVLKLVIFVLFLVNTRFWLLLWALGQPRSVLQPHGHTPAHALSAIQPQSSNAKCSRLTAHNCNFSWHYSDSCYPKALDRARFCVVLRICPTFFRVGGWMLLTVTHVKEITMFARYEMRMNIAVWDEKWLYVLVRYITPVKKGKGEATI